MDIQGRTCSTYVIFGRIHDRVKLACSSYVSTWNARAKSNAPDYYDRKTEKYQERIVLASTKSNN